MAEPTSHTVNVKAGFNQQRTTRMTQAMEGEYTTFANEVPPSEDADATRNQCQRFGSVAEAS